VTLPIISIVGRPNVGKSTLFNRIIGRREAIVDDAPGITRDRKSADTDWEGIPFRLVDTGGFIPKGSNAIEKGVSRQVLQAIEESDVIIHVVDCHSGITDIDGEVARSLRKCGKPLLLAVNKVDNDTRELEAAQFIRLGLGEPQTVSAQAGRGVGDLLSAAVALLGPGATPGEEDPDDRLRLAIVGKPNVGKSTFINRILGQERMLVTDIPGTTRDSVDVDVTWKGRIISLVDTAGLRRRSRVDGEVEYYSGLRARRAINDCDVACVFVDASEKITQQDMHVIAQVIAGRKGILLILNKWDLVKDDPDKLQELQLSQELKLQGLSYLPILAISCKTGRKVEQVLDTVWRIGQERQKRISSPQLNVFLEEVNRAYQPPAVRGKRVRIVYGTQVGTAPPKFAFFSNYPALITENYKRYLENQLRARFGFEGVPISFLFKKK